MGDNQENVTPMPESLYEEYNRQMENKDKALKTGKPFGDLESQPPVVNVNNTVYSSSQGSSGAGLDPNNVSDNIKSFITKETPADNGQVDSFVNNDQVTENDFQQKIVEDLVFLGRIKKTIGFHGHKIVLQTLTGLQELDIIDEVSHFDPPTRVAASTIGTIVRSVKTFNNQKFYAEKQQEIPYSKFPNIDEAKLWVLQWQGPVINQLYEKYLELKQLQDEQIEEIKN